MHPLPLIHRQRDRDTGTERKSQRQRQTDKRIMWGTSYWFYSQHWSWEEIIKQNICISYLTVHKPLLYTSLFLSPQTGRQGMSDQDQIFCNPKEKCQKKIPSCFFSLLHLRYFISHSKVKRGAQCDNTIKAYREDNEMRVKEMDEHNHSGKPFYSIY